MAATRTRLIPPEVDAAALAAVASHVGSDENVHGIVDTARLVTIDNIGQHAPAPDLTTLVTLAPPSSGRNVIQPSAAVDPLTVNTTTGDQIASFASDRRLKLPGATSSALGLLLGGDASLWRSASGVVEATNFRTTGSVTVAGGYPSRFSVGAATSTPLIAQGAAAQSVPVFRAADSADADLLSLGASGALALKNAVWHTSGAANRFYFDSGSSYYGAPGTHQWRTSTDATRMVLSDAGQLQLPVQGSTGGLLIGGDVPFYRAGAGIGRIDGRLDVNGVERLAIDVWHGALAGQLDRLHYASQVTYHRAGTGGTVWQDNAAATIASLTAAGIFSAAGVGVGSGGVFSSAVPGRPSIGWSSGLMTTNLNAATNSTRHLMAAAQTSNPWELQDSTSAVKLSFNTAGSVTSFGGHFQTNTGLFGQTAAGSTADFLLRSSVSGDSSYRFVARTGGKLEWGSGSALDTSFERNAANTLKSSGALQAGGALYAAHATAQEVVLGNIGSMPSVRLNDVDMQRSASGEARWTGSGSATQTREVIRMIAAQTPNPWELQDSTGALMAGFSPSGRIGVAGATPHATAAVNVSGGTMIRTGSSAGVVRAQGSVTFSADSGAQIPIASGGVNLGISTGTPTYGVIESGAAYDHHLRIDGVTHLSVIDGFADGETALSLRRRLAGAETVQRVSMGDPDSAGAGFRSLRVPN